MLIRSAAQWLIMIPLVAILYRSEATTASVSAASRLGLWALRQTNRLHFRVGCGQSDRLACGLAAPDSDRLDALRSKALKAKACGNGQAPRSVAAGMSARRNRWPALYAKARGSKAEDHQRGKARNHDG